MEMIFDHFFFCFILEFITRFLRQLKQAIIDKIVAAIDCYTSVEAWPVLFYTLEAFLMQDKPKKKKLPSRTLDSVDLMG